MKTFTIADIRSWEPCYDPSRHLPEGWEGTAVDILRNAEIPTQDRLWVVCRTGLISNKILRLFAVWCARQVQHLMTDERSVRALDVAEAYANGNVRDSGLGAAYAARAAAWDAAWAAMEAAYAASDAARDAAWAASDAARDAQIEKLIEIIEGAE